MSEHDAPAAHEWETTLERLEVQISRAERMGGTGADAGLELSLPDSLSTIPRYLLARAQRLVERHQRLVSGPPAPAERVAGGTLHERVGHLITGPREPVSFEVFGSLTEDAPQQD
jgi:hypothetical protein